jgi:hypothetical protein
MTTGSEPLYQLQTEFKTDQKGVTHLTAEQHIYLNGTTLITYLAF